MMTGGLAAARALLNEGIDIAFGIPGVHNLDLYEGMRQQPELRHVLARHEQGAGFMADGFARATGKPAAVLTITGPGITNALTAIAQADSDHSPMLAIASQIDAPDVGREKGDLHELRDQLATVSGVVSWSRRVTAVEEIPWAIHEAALYMRSHSRPAYVEIPKDILSAEGSPQFPGRAEPIRPGAETAAVERAASLLLAAERPLLHIGRGAVVSGASAEVVELAELLGAPVFTSSLGKGIIPHDHPLNLGLVNWAIADYQKELYAQADLVLVVGTRRGPISSGYGQLPVPQHSVQIDREPSALGRCYPIDLGLLGDARAVLRQLLARIRGRDRASLSAWTRQAQDAYQRHLAAIEQASARELHIVRSLRAALPPDTVLTNDMTLLCYRLLQHFPATDSSTFLFPFHLGTLGFGLPAAIGAKLGRPRQPVVAVCGDGGFMFCLQELATAIKYKLQLVVLLCNDNCYSSVRQSQERRFPGRRYEVDVVNPDFALLARAFGARGVRLRSLDEAGDGVRQALDMPGVTILEAPVDLSLP